MSSGCLINNNYCSTHSLSSSVSLSSSTLLATKHSLFHATPPPRSSPPSSSPPTTESPHSSSHLPLPLSSISSSPHHLLSSTVGPTAAVAPQTLRVCHLNANSLRHLPSKFIWFQSNLFLSLINSSLKISQNTF